MRAQREPTDAGSSRRRAGRWPPWPRPPSSTLPASSPSRRSSGECPRPGPPALDMLQGAAQRLAQGGRGDERRAVPDRGLPGRPDHAAVRLLRRRLEGHHRGVHGRARTTGAAREPALEWFTTVPFGMNPEGMAAWYYQGDGLKLWEETYAAFNLVPRPGPAVAPQMAGWFRKKINTIGDYKGLKMRIGTGLGGKVVRQGGRHGGPHARPRDLRRPRAGRDRRRRMGRAARRHEAGPAEYRALLLLPGLARARHRDRVRLQQEGVRGAPGRPAADARPCRGGRAGLWPRGLPHEERDRARAAQDRVQGQGRGAPAPGAGAARSQEARGRGRPRKNPRRPRWPGRSTRRSRSSRRWSGPGTTSPKAPTISSSPRDHASPRPRPAGSRSPRRARLRRRAHRRRAGDASPVPDRRPQRGVGGQPSHGRGAQGRAQGAWLRRTAAT